MSSCKLQSNNRRVLHSRWSFARRYHLMVRGEDGSQPRLRTSVRSSRQYAASSHLVRCRGRWSVPRMPCCSVPSEHGQKEGEHKKFGFSIVTDNLSRPPPATHWLCKSTPREMSATTPSPSRASVRARSYSLSSRILCRFHIEKISMKPSARWTVLRRMRSKPPRTRLALLWRSW